MNDTPWFKCYPSDFLNGVSELTPNELAVYTVVLMRMYDEGGPITDDPDRIARRCNMRPTTCKKAIEALIGYGKLIRDEGQLYNFRARNEIKSRQKVSEKSAENARARWKKEAEKANENNDPPVRPHSNGTANDMPTRGQKPEARSQIDTDPNGSVVGVPADPPEKVPIKKAFDNYNIAAEELGLPVAKTLSEDRKKKLRARLKEHGMDGWNRALEAMEGASFLLGDNDRGWRADLDFLLQPKSFNRLIEGGYAGKEST